MKKHAFAMIAVAVVACVVAAIAVALQILPMHFFVLPPAQAQASLANISSTCSMLKECALKPGDILIRRHNTSRTKLFEIFIHSYFTHSAFYYGDGAIIEAGGTETDRRDDIRALSFSQSDWATDPLETWVVFRPTTASSSSIERLRAYMKGVADDPEYVFGFRTSKRSKRASCSDIIFDGLIASNIVPDMDRPDVMTPDYLFNYLIFHPGDFAVAVHGSAEGVGGE